MPPTASTAPLSRRVTWDVYCRVVDNHGDAGVCWRLATDLASRGVAVRLWIDDARALAWMAPDGCTGVTVQPWPTTDAELARAQGDSADVVVEAFGCDLPETCLRHMAAAAQRGNAPLWIDLEYLSAEPYAERSHGLPSLQATGSGRGLTRWFFYPGFTPGSGGLLRGPAPARRAAAVDGARWLAEHAIAPRPGERVVSLFCYPNSAVPGLVQALADKPTLLLTTPGHATEQVAQALRERHRSSALRTQALPWLRQTDYDLLLASCDVNFVRGEDSLVRAVWAGRPFLWQLYPQHDGAHAAKLDAFLSRSLAAADPTVAAAVRRAAHCWNALSDGAPASRPGSAWTLLNDPAQMSAWAAHCRVWCDGLQQQPDLTTRLLAFADAKRGDPQARI